MPPGEAPDTRQLLDLLATHGACAEPGRAALVQALGAQLGLRSVALSRVAVAPGAVEAAPPASRDAASPAPQGRPQPPPAAGDGTPAAAGDGSREERARLKREGMELLRHAGRREDDLRSILRRIDAAGAEQLEGLSARLDDLRQHVARDVETRARTVRGEAEAACREGRLQRRDLRALRVAMENGDPKALHLVLQELEAKLATGDGPRRRAVRPILWAAIAAQVLLAAWLAWADRATLLDAGAWASFPGRVRAALSGDSP